MYTEEDDKRKLPIVRFLVSLILIILFILLLVWIISKVGSGKDRDYDGLRNRMFNDNVQTMKETGILYFTKERLPINIGDTSTVTLKELIDGKYILPIKDFDGNKCDVEKSFVSVTKKDKHYQMMVNLKCNEEDDYILVDIGCYAYCGESYVCEKKEQQKPKPNTKDKPTPTPNSYNPYCELVVNGTKGENGWYTGNAVVTFKNKRPGSNASLVVYNLYPEGSTATSNKIDNYVVSSDGTTTVYGYVRDSKGRSATCKVVIKKDSTVPNCNLYIVSGTRDSDGVFVSNVLVGLKYNDSTSKVNSYGITNLNTATYNFKDKYTVTNNGKTTVYGYVKDNAGNKAVCNLVINKKKPNTSIISEPSCVLEVKSGLKENNYYLSNVTIGFKNKTTTNNATIVGYGLGTSETYRNNNTYVVNTNGTKTIYGYVKDSNGYKAVCIITVTKKTKEYEYSKLINAQYSAWSNWQTFTYNPAQPPLFGNYNLIQIENLGKKTVIDYYKEEKGQAIYQNIQVKVGTTTQKYCNGYSYFREINKTTTYAIKDGTGWTYVGMVTTSSSPMDTLAVKYEFVGFDWKCIGCERVPRKIWNKYTRVVGQAIENTVVTSNVTVTCSSTVTKTIDIFDYIPKFVRYDIIRVPVYKDIYEYRKRTRTLVNAGFTDLKWSISNNDLVLINNGYKLTGKTRIV